MWWLVVEGGVGGSEISEIIFLIKFAQFSRLPLLRPTFRHFDQLPADHMLFKPEAYVKIRGTFRKVQISLRKSNFQKIIWEKQKLNYFRSKIFQIVGLSRFKFWTFWKFYWKVYLGETKFKFLNVFVFPPRFLRNLKSSKWSRRNKPFQTPCAYKFTFAFFPMSV